MHELGIVFHTIRTIEEVAAEQGLTRVGSVTLELGEVSGAIPQELVSCWDWAVNRTELLRGAPLKDRKSTRLNSSHSGQSRMPSSA